LVTAGLATAEAIEISQMSTAEGVPATVDANNSTYISRDLNRNSTVRYGCKQLMIFGEFCEKLFRKATDT
jgi:hypothetical protein